MKCRPAGRHLSKHLIGARCGRIVSAPQCGDNRFRAALLARSCVCGRRPACAEDTHRGCFAQHGYDGRMRSRSPRREWTRLRFAEEMRRPVRPIPNPPWAIYRSRTRTARVSSSPAAMSGAVAVDATAIQHAAIEATNTAPARASNEWRGDGSLAVSTSASAAVRLPPTGRSLGLLRTRETAETGPGIGEKSAARMIDW